MRWLAIFSAGALIISEAAHADAFSDCAAKGDLDRRIVSCTQAIAQGTDNKRQLTIAYSLRGSAYAQKGDYDRAIADLTKSVELDPRNIFVYTARGDAYRLKGELDSAIADFS